MYADIIIMAYIHLRLLQYCTIIFELIEKLYASARTHPHAHTHTHTHTHSNSLCSEFLTNKDLSFYKFSVTRFK